MTKEDLKWSYCWQCKVNTAICPECGQSLCTVDCECNQPEWRAMRDECVNNNEVPELPSLEEIQERGRILTEYRIFQLFPPTDDDFEFFDEMCKKVEGKI